MSGKASDSNCGRLKLAPRAFTRTRALLSAPGSQHDPAQPTVGAIPPLYAKPFAVARQRGPAGACALSTRPGAPFWSTLPS